MKPTGSNLRPHRPAKVKSGSSPARLPAAWRTHLDQILISAPNLRRRVKALAGEIQAEFTGRELVVVSLLNGTIMFLADLIRHLSLPMRLDFIGVSSYRGGTESRNLIYTKELRLDVRNRDVLLVDDILDTGRTLHQVREKLELLQPSRIKICVLLDKPARRLQPVRADYVGFEIPDLFVVGYGLDFAEKYRNLPFVAVLKPHIYQGQHETGRPLDGRSGVTRGVTKTSNSNG